MSSTFPYEVRRLEKSIEEPLQKRFLAYTGGLVRVEPSGFIMPTHYEKYAQKYFNFQFKPDDVIIMSHPKCGTTWTQEIVWTMRNNADTTTKLELGVRSPFLEFDSLEAAHLEPLDEWVEEFNQKNPGKDYKDEGLYLNLAETKFSPRTIKTHLPPALINPNFIDVAKVVYVARNPKDACVSYYHHQRLVKCSEFIGDFAEFVDYWCQDLITQAPYWYHISEAWSLRDHPNFIFLFYEDMKEDIMRELRRLNAFLGTSLTETQLQTVAEHTSFSNMKSKSTTNPTEAAIKIGRFKEGEAEFVRKGKTGDWSNYFTPELEAKFDAWMSSWKEKAKDIPFRYQI